MVPDGWAVTHLKSIVDGPIKNGYSPVASKTETGYWVLSLGALSDNGLIPCAVKPVDPEKNVLQSILSAGDFLLSRSNTPDKVGRSVRFRGEISNCSYPDLMMRFRVDRKLVNECFIEQKLKSHPIRSYYQSHAAGSSGTMVKINKATVEKPPLLLPPLWEQSRIAKILSTWDQAIETTEKLIENSKAQKKALMQQLLTGKKRLPGFSDEWREPGLGELFSERKEVNRLDLPLLSITQNRGVIFRADVGRKDTSSEDKTKYKRLCPYDIGYNTMRMWQGVSALSDKEGIVSPAYTIVTPNSRSHPKYMAYLFKLPKTIHDFYRCSQGLVSDTWNLKYPNFCEVKVKIPSPAEQAAIANVLQSADHGTEKLIQQLENLQSQKTALMQQLLTGKRRVKVAT